jgi:hypothetical protein
MNSIVKKYASTFKLKKVVSKKQIQFYNNQELVSEIEVNNPKVFKYKSLGKWKKCKTSEIIHMILNNIPAHE